MRSSIVLLIALLCMAHALSAQSIRVSLSEISGTKYFSEHAIRDSIGYGASRLILRSALRDSVRAIASNVRAFYFAHGFYGAHVDSMLVDVAADSTSATIAIKISEGIKSTIDSINFTGNHALTLLQLRESSPMHHGDVPDPKELERDLDAILIRYENFGFPFATIALDSFFYSATSGLKFDFMIDEGPLVTVRDIISAKKIDTDPYVIRRASGLEFNKPYQQLQIDKVHANLEKLEIFSSISEPVIQMRTIHDAVLATTLEEANTTVFDGIVGYLPGSGTVPGYFIGSVDLSFLNLFSSARKLGLHWSRKEISAQDLWVTYHEPWLFGLPVSLDIRVDQHEQDSTFTRRDGILGASTILGEGFTITGSISAASTSPGGPTSIIENSSELDAGFELRYDTRDNVYSPRSGVFYSTHYAAGNKSISGTSSAIQHVDVDAEIVRSFLVQSVAVLALHGAVVSSAALDASDLYRVGGAGSVRGYRDQQFYASRVAWGTVEFRQLIAPRSFLFVFADGGYYARVATLDQPLPDQAALLGYGLGIQTTSPLGLMKVSLALGKNDPFGQAKVHFEVVNSF